MCAFQIFLVVLFKLLSSIAYFFPGESLNIILCRTSQDIFVVLPSLDSVQDAVSTAKSWLKKCMPFLASTSSEAPTSLLKLEALKVHVGSCM